MHRIGVLLLCGFGRCFFRYTEFAEDIVEHIHDLVQLIHELAQGVEQVLGGFCGVVQLLLVVLYRLTTAGIWMERLVINVMT